MLIDGLETWCHMNINEEYTIILYTKLGERDISPLAIMKIKAVGLKLKQVCFFKSTDY